MIKNFVDGLSVVACIVLLANITNCAKQTTVNKPQGNIYFDFDKSNINPEYRPVIEQNASYLRSNPKANAVIEGHCDERGSKEYNKKLGQRRANEVRKALVGLGVEENRIATVSYGEEKPFCIFEFSPSLKGKYDKEIENCHAQNRRVEIQK